MQLSGAEISSLLGAYLWPFIRISCMFLAAPFFGARQVVSTKIRLSLAIAVTWLAVPLIPLPPAVEAFSMAGILITVQQIVIGVCMGFMLQLVFSALVIAGNSIAMTMGLGFAQFVDPNGISIPVVSHFFTILGTLLFLSMNGHLVAIQVIIESFQSLPVGLAELQKDMFIHLVLWGSKMFVGAILIALPAVVTLTLINISFGVMTRAAPQLNIFAVGFPTTMLMGYVVMFLTLPNMLPRFTTLLMQSFDDIGKLFL